MQGQFLHTHTWNVSTHTHRCFALRLYKFFNDPSCRAITLRWKPPGKSRWLSCVNSHPLLLLFTEEEPTQADTQAQHLNTWKWQAILAIAGTQKFRVHSTTTSTSINDSCSHGTTQLMNRRSVTVLLTLCVSQAWNQISLLIYSRFPFKVTQKLNSSWEEFFLKYKEIHRTSSSMTVTVGQLCRSTHTLFLSLSDSVWYYSCMYPHSQELLP